MNQPLRLSDIPMWLCDPLSAEVRASLERLAAADDVVRLAVMPDVHLATDVCVGVVLATRERLYPQAVGGDIGCGMAAVAFDAEAAAIDNEQAAARMLAGLYARVPTNRHSTRTQPDWPAELAAATLSDPRLDKLKQRDGRVQLGTLGRGNHFVELQRDADDRLWLMVHSGSRGAGQGITSFHLDRAAGEGRFPGLNVNDPQGAAYLHDAAWAERYAFANRRALLQAVAALLQAEFSIACDWSTLIHESHNHVRRESHFGESLLVHRKGAQPAAEGQPGIIPGSMGTVSFHVRGRGCAAALHSSSHGAGRTLSRTEARQRISRRQLQRELEGVWFDHRRSDTIREEAPGAYRDIRRVLRAQRDLTRIERELRPVLCYQGE
jgi:tRNA-splicing ligase RtcB